MFNNFVQMKSIITDFKIAELSPKLLSKRLKSPDLVILDLHSVQRKPNLNYAIIFIMRLLSIHVLNLIYILLSLNFKFLLYFVYIIIIIVILSTKITKIEVLI